ncbi:MULTISPECIES: helix-turn-helix domain-containing protein [Lentzea]|jgi:excisionase family DNA binding protein|uniref:DNA binding domain-containing protein, excisionase family n=2 Tax=Lentzea TaxID=165301 RepID=A0A1H9XYT7_9PSEU|nr:MULTISPECIES: helix-turn-helix domain-containing protein [Lentzea]MDX3657959.1 helix-turn-helix domain-containing protein [Streptomyces sp. ID05-26A]MCR3747249.1 DNA binding domain-containing protein, excisionase family [Lentzea californiensis]MCX2952324.1 helix-turn-helix domain-containing protein [Lentzea sp. NEAU-D7]MDX8143935.1 helix-turn-helix domain-containing protein [Lentzea sp. BCCO 10_0061]RDI16358.1 excisionase family DNA binding protein [Lentzea flaviverrucosa]
MNDIAYRVEEVARALRVGRTKVFDLIRAGELVSVKIGGSRRVPASSVQAYLSRLIAEAA